MLSSSTSHTRSLPPPSAGSHFCHDSSDTGSDSDTSQTSFTRPLDHQYILPEPFHVNCPWCNSQPEWTDLELFLEHLKSIHGYKIFEVTQVSAVLQPYLSMYAAGELPSKLLGDPIVYPKDPDFRQTLFRKRLENVLADQMQEREKEGKLPRPCLFCKVVPDNRTQLFRHMFTVHNFNIGNPENMVYVSHFLDLLSIELAELRCLYCGHTFKDSKTLRSHMRKKNHFRIPSSAVQYDRFYLINYLESGKNWEALLSEPEGDGNGEEEEEERWSDWDGIEKEEVPCLWCDMVGESANACARHMLEEHGFDLVGLAKKCSDHQIIRWVNYLRYSKLNARCPAMQCSVTSANPIEHVACLQPHLNTLAPPTLPPVSVAPLDYKALYEVAKELSVCPTDPPVPMQGLHITSSNSKEFHPKTNEHQAREKPFDGERPSWEDPQFLLPILDTDPLIPFVLQYTIQEEEHAEIEE